MKICRVDGTVHATIKDDTLVAEKILLTQPLDLGGRPQGAPLLAIDRANAGVGDLVLVMKEGGSARMILGNEKSPVQCLAVAVIDDIHVSEEITP